MQVGLQVLKDDQRVLQCHESHTDWAYHSQVGSSAAIFNASYTIDSLMLRYQGVDWRDSVNHACNGRSALPTGSSFAHCALNCLLPPVSECKFDCFAMREPNRHS